SDFWNGYLQLTFHTSSGANYTIWGTGQNQFSVALSGSTQTLATFNNVSSASIFLADLYNFNSGLWTGSNLITADIDGGAGKDVIQGIANNSTITNIIQGGAGADILSGGIGKDIFVYTSVNDSPYAGQLNSGGQQAQTWDQI